MSWPWAVIYSFVLHQLVLHELNEEGPRLPNWGSRFTVSMTRLEAVNAVEHPHVEGGGDGALLPVAQYVDVLVVPAVGQLVHQGGGSRGRRR